MEEELGTGLLFASIFQKKKDNYAIVASNQYSAQRIYEFLLNFLKEEEVVFFPNDELLRAENLASSRELLAQRLYALGRLQSGAKQILVTHTSALLRYLPDPKRFSEETMELKVGATCDLTELKERLVSIGYEATNRVERSLTFSSRGDILDIYTVSYADPIRVEFFGDEIESIRLFDVATQQSKETLSSCQILPGTDIFLSDDEVIDFLHRAKEQLGKDKSLVNEDVGRLLEANVGQDFERFVSRNYKNELYRYYGFAIQKSCSVLSYFDPSLIYFTNKEQYIQSVEMIQSESFDFLNELFIKARSITHLSLYMSTDEALFGKRGVVFSEPFAKSSDDYLFPVHTITPAGRNIASIPTTIQNYLATNDKVVLALPEPHQKQTVLGFLEDLGIASEEVKGFALPKGKLGISNIPLDTGFEIPDLGIAYLTVTELFNHRASSSRYTARFRNAAVLRSYEDLRPGDYIVHEYNGIGQFLDIKTMEIDGMHRDFLHIAYANNEYLYVPLEQFRLVRKYAGREGAAPKLSHLSSGEWKKKKAKIKERINELADRLIALYGARARNEGFAFPPDDELQAQFEDEFPYELTKDQLEAVAATKEDMQKSEIMDRLICGDVGFGKTEVAFRAVFKCVSAGKQAALLCPTTLLARQHYEVAIDRFATFGIRIAVLSRLVSEAEVKKTLAGLEDGSIDFVIGTHKLLSKSVVFKDLGLLVVDEEQRFGVEQKERIKEIKNTVDVLTLSATPIPRTLQMSLVGIRPLSEITTPPTSRSPIQTYVTPFKQEAVDELIKRELARNGQVFYVHNVVATIYATASKLARRIPSAAIGVVHGQMPKEEIESVMEKFYDGELNVLVCSSIIENGIDVPNANLIIVEDADHFGLAQLYQIKGRVGRGNRIAYAYLLYRPQKNMKSDAEKRLKAIQEFTELGSGYKIAQRDLMIRGAGDILGPEQAGFIDSIGLNLYLKLLNEAIEEKKTGVVPPPPVARKLFNIDAYIPADYAGKSDKIELYQELEDIDSLDKIPSFTRKVRDIYGRLPEEVELLIQKKRIDLYLDESEFESVEEKENSVDVQMTKEFSRLDGIGNELFAELSPYLTLLRVTFYERKLRFILKKRKQWLKDLETILQKIHKVALKHRS